MNLRINHDKQEEKAVLQLIIYFPMAAITETELVGKNGKYKFLLSLKEEFSPKGEIRGKVALIFIYLVLQ